MMDIDKKLYIHVQLKEPHPVCMRLTKYGWEDLDYELDTMWCVASRGGGNNKAVAVKIQGMNHPFPRDFVCVSVGSTVYVIGGWDFGRAPSSDPPVVSDIWFTNIYINDNDDVDVDVDSSSLSSHAWTKGAPMQYPRYAASGVAANGKIYVFGGGFVGERNQQTWAEVYDIKSNTWSSLPTSPPDISYYARNSALFNNRLILVNIVNKEVSEESGPEDWGSLYSYDVILGNWEIHDPRFGIWNKTQLATVVSTTTTTPGTPFLVTYKDCLLHAYNILQKKWTIVDGLNPGIDIPSHPLDDIIDTRILSLSENNVCVLWAQYCGGGITVYCSNLTFCEETDHYCGGSLVATVQSRDQFEFQLGLSLMACLAIATTNIKRKKEGELQEDLKKHKMIASIENV